MKFKKTADKIADAVNESIKTSGQEGITHILIQLDGDVSESWQNLHISGNVDKRTIVSVMEQATVSVKEMTEGNTEMEIEALKSLIKTLKQLTSKGVSE